MLALHLAAQSRDRAIAELGASVERIDHVIEERVAIGDRERTGGGEDGGDLVCRKVRRGGAWTWAAVPARVEPFRT